MGFKLLKPSFCLFYSFLHFTASKPLDHHFICTTHKHQKLVFAESKKGAVDKERMYYRLSWINFTVPSMICHLQQRTFNTEEPNVR